MNIMCWKTEAALLLLLAIACQYVQCDNCTAGEAASSCKVSFLSLVLSTAVTETFV
jgi:hypothetical protein